MAKRWRQVEEIRGLAQLAVVMIHVSSTFAGQTRLGLWLNQLSRFAVPLFVLLSGFCLTADREERGAAQRLAFVRRHLGRVLIPYAIWSVLYLAYRALWEPLGLGEAVRLFFQGKSYIHLYFLLVMAQLYLLYWPLRALYRRWRYATIAGALAVSLGMQILVYLSARGTLTLPPLFFSYSTLCPAYLFYFVLGFWLRERVERGGAWAKPPWPAVLAGAAAAFALVLADTGSLAVAGVSIRPAVLPYVIAMFALLWRYAARPHRLWRAVGRDSYLLYCVHPMVYHALTMLYGRTALAGIVPPNAYLLLLYAATVLLSLVCCAILRRLPFAARLGA